MDGNKTNNQKVYVSDLFIHAQEIRNNLVDMWYKLSQFHFRLRFTHWTFRSAAATQFTAHVDVTYSMPLLSSRRVTLQPLLRAFFFSFYANPFSSIKSHMSLALRNAWVKTKEMNGLDIKSLSNSFHWVKFF